MGYLLEICEFFKRIRTCINGLCTEARVAYRRECAEVDDFGNFAAKKQSRLKLLRPARAQTKTRCPTNTTISNSILQDGD